MKFAFAAILLLAPLKATAGERDLASLHQFNGNVHLAPKLRLLLHSRLRFNNHVSDFLQFRAGPILFYDWRRRFQWQAGYYQLQQRSAGRMVAGQRPWAGAQVRVWGNGRWSLDWRNLIERHAFSGPGDFTRARTRAMLNLLPKAGWQPYASAEALFLRGHAIGRYAAGLNYATAGGHLLGFGYEYRSSLDAPASHIITTLIQFRLRGDRVRQKPGQAEVPQ